MKHIRGTLILFVLIACFSGCKKTATVQKITGDTIEGTWELRSEQSSMIPTVYYTAGNGNRIKFTGHQYEFYTNGQLVKSGSYTLVSDPTAEAATCLNIQAGQFTNRIVYDSNNNPPKLFIQVSGDKLSFLGGCFAVDAGSRKEYKRL